MELYVDQLKHYRYNIESHRNYSKTKGSTYHRYCNSIFTFDIEVSSSWKDGPEIKSYEKGYTADYWNSLTPLALPYIWQFSAEDGGVYYGRELQTFEKVLEDIPKDYSVIIWVHNLSYEFQFLCNLFEWDYIFARSPHKTITCIPKKYPNVEFRCSYILTRLSLSAWGKQLGLPKMVGDLDYEVLRTPLTPLDDKEMGYCERDCLVVEKGIKDYRRRYGNLRDIPLTQTGTVRRDVKNMLTSDPNYVRKIKTLIPHSAEEYRMLMQVFAGGYTHANRLHSGRVQTGLIQHYDFASSYPTVMISEKFPSSPWVYTGKEFPEESTFTDFAYILHLEFSQLNCITSNTYIQRNKSNGSNMVYDNGRVISADKLEIFITEQDYLTIKETYTWKNMEVLGVYRSFKDYLPRPFMEYILTLYKNKTTLKDVDGMEDLYMQSKQYINSMFGMCVTAIVQSNVKLENGEWIVEELTPEVVEEKLDKLRDKREREKRYFLSYSWGCWVTAYARRNLWKCIESCDLDVMYCDTDSIFVLGKQDFSWYNDEITEKLRIACEKRNLDFEMTRPKTKKGIAKPLGVFAPEDECCEFLTLGAKRYVERRISDGKLHLTVSGINKEAVGLLNDDIRNFKDGFDFDKDADCVRKQLGIYLSDMPTVVYPDGYKSEFRYGINMRRNGYKLSITDEYKTLIDYLEYNISMLDENDIIKERGEFSQLNWKKRYE